MSLKIAPGEFVAFVGAVRLRQVDADASDARVRAAASGTIFYDGQDLNSLDLRLVRQQMGVVLQVSRVMPTEIYRNIVGASRRAR